VLGLNTRVKVIHAVNRTEPDTVDIDALVQNFRESRKGREEEEEEEEESEFEYR
jgi:hypothetical protein